MHQFREHIILKLATAFLIAALITPSVVKLTHLYADHEHEVCTSNNTEHLHERNLDCEFYKFKKNAESYVNLNYDDQELFIRIQKSTKYYYTHLTSRQQLNVSLRGPPSLI